MRILNAARLKRCDVVHCTEGKRCARSKPVKTIVPACIAMMKLSHSDRSDASVKVRVSS